jgi:acyl dehydratase
LKNKGVIKLAEEFLITDEMRKALGSLINICITKIERSKIKMFVEATTDNNPLWQDEEYARKTVHGGTLVPPGFLVAMQVEGESPGFYMPYMLNLKGAIDAGGEWEFFRPIRPDDIIVVDRKYVDLYEKKGSLGNMLFNVFETTYRNQRGEIVAKGKWTSIRLDAPGVEDYEGRKVD